MMVVQIDQTTLKSPTVLAPMAGITDSSYRQLASSFGAGMVVSEMISAKALYYGDKKTIELTKIEDLECPTALQIFGSDPKIMGRAAAFLSKDPNVDFIDINMGCPAPKIVKNGDGSALMKKPKLAYEVMRETVQASRVPVTVKFRLGWDEKSKNAAELIELAQTAGVSAITVHGRTREMYYSGKADWNQLKQLRELCEIPFIANGDVFTPEDGKHLLEYTKADAIAIGRGAIGNPWIFTQIDELFETGQYRVPDFDEVIDVMIKHLMMSVEQKGERRGILEMRKPMAHYIKGMKGAKKVRDQMNRTTNLEELLELLHSL